MNPLLADLSDEQVALLKIIYDEYESNTRWPIWQYVELTLPAGAARRILDSLPVVGDSSSPVGARYGLVHWSETAGSPPNPGTDIGLTIAGLHQIAPQGPLSNLWIKLLRYLVTRQSQLQPSPTEVVQCTVTVDEVQKHLSTDAASDVETSDAERRLKQLRLLLDHERPLWGRVRPPFPNSPWQIEVPATIVEEYGDIETVEEYIERVTQIVAPEFVPSTSRSSGLSLPQAITVLEATWRLRMNRQLFESLDASSMERLSLPITSTGDFDSACSALADVLSHIQVPPDDTIKRKGRPITVLRDWLHGWLPEASADRVDDAIDVLQKIVDVRVGSQHSDARHKFIAAFESLGLRHPSSDLQQTWHELEHLAVGALEAIGEEIRANQLAGTDQTGSPSKPSSSSASSASDAGPV